MGRYRFRKDGTSPRTSTGRCTSSITTRGKLRGSIPEIGTYLLEGSLTLPPLPSFPFLFCCRFNRLPSRPRTSSKRAPASAHPRAHIVDLRVVERYDDALPSLSPSPPRRLRSPPFSRIAHESRAISRRYAISTRDSARECVFVYGVYCKSRARAFSSWFCGQNYVAGFPPSLPPPLAE